MGRPHKQTMSSHESTGRTRLLHVKLPDPQICYMGNTNHHELGQRTAPFVPHALCDVRAMFAACQHTKMLSMAQHASSYNLLGPTYQTKLSNLWQRWA